MSNYRNQAINAAFYADPVLLKQLIDEGHFSKSLIDDTGMLNVPFPIWRIPQCWEIAMGNDPEIYRKIMTPEEAAILTEYMTGTVTRGTAAALSGKLRRESPFRMTVPAREVDPAWNTDEPVMIQGIIDAWFEEDGEIVLVDYKTDRRISAEELADRYRIQLDYYVRALDAIEGLPVKERILWSFAHGQEVPA